MAGIQRYLQRNDEKLLEPWWSQFRRSNSTWWINYFMDLGEQNLFDLSVIYYVEYIRFCYIRLLQKKLEVSSRWNNQRMRTVRSSTCPSGRPAVIYDAPELFGGYKSSSSNAINELILAKTICLEPSSFGCSTNFLNFSSLMTH